MVEVDYLIIGQGIAGTSLSFQLLHEGAKVFVINKEDLTVSSSVAAGLYNPVTGRRMVKTWNADKIFPLIEPFYQEIEKLVGEKVLNPTPIYRPFVDYAEQNDWFAKCEEESFSTYIEQLFDTPQYEPYVKNPFGGIKLKNCGWLSIPVLLQSWKKYLEKMGIYKDEEFNEDELVLSEDAVEYKNIRAKKIIYCNGISIEKSRYWNWVPMRPVKGEVLTIKTSADLKDIINRGIFFLRIKENIYKVGSTYDNQRIDYEPTEEAKKDILTRLSGLVKLDLEVIEHKAGVRPATKDRKPLIGVHPKLQTLVIFNGLGTKGVSIAPYGAQELTKYLLQKEELPDDVNIKRYFSLYYT